MAAEISVRIVTTRPPEDDARPFVVAAVAHDGIEEPFAVWCDGQAWREREARGPAHGPFASYEAAFTTALESAFARARDYAYPRP